MLEPLTKRTVVIGNGGSGKSTLAEAIANLAHIPAVDLDLLHWEEGGYGLKRNEDVARKMVIDISDQPRWIIEGVFGWLAKSHFPEQPLWFGWIFRGVFVAPDYSRAVCGEERRVTTTPN
jgi:adenylate kinase family enzyme